MLLNVPDELGDDDVAGAWRRAVLDEKAVAADGGSLAVSKEDRLSGRRCLIEHLHDVNRILFTGRCAILSEPKLHTSPSGIACQVCPRVIDSSVHCAAMVAFDEIKRPWKLAVDSSMKD